MWGWFHQHRCHMILVSRTTLRKKQIISCKLLTR
jgi:hypothetical protein